MTTSSAHYAAARAALARALSADENGDPASALDLYRFAAEGLLRGLRTDRNRTQTAQSRQLAEKIIQRAEHIKTALSGRSSTAADGGGASLGAGEDAGPRFRDVVGCDKVKQALREAVMLPRTFPQLFTGRRKPPSRILLYGPPGTGKTLLVQALSNESDCKFVSISASDILSKWQGESERALRKVFEDARRNSPCILFIDEIDAIGRARTGDEQESTRRLKTELLVQLEGMRSGDADAQVVVIAATNTPWELDPALRRRFQRRIYVPLPGEAARAGILQQFTLDGSASVSPAMIRSMAARTSGFSGADVASMAQDALMEPVRECIRATHFLPCPMPDGSTKYMPCSPDTPGAVERSVTQLERDSLLCPQVVDRHFASALERSRPTVNLRELRHFVDFARKYGEKDDLGERSLVDELPEAPSAPLASAAAPSAATAASAPAPPSHSLPGGHSSRGRGRMMLLS